MHGLRFDRFLSGTALALVLALGQGASAQTQSPAANPEPAIEALVPVPEPADVPPPSAADVGAEPAAPAPAVKAAETPAPAEAAKAAEAPKPADTPAAAPQTAEKPAEPAASPAATAQSTPSEPFAKLAPADRPIAAALRDIAPQKLARMFDRKADRTAVEAFYQGREYTPLWIENGAPSARAKAAIAFLGKVDADGLDPADYVAPDFKAAQSPEAMAEAEFKLTATILTFARHASTGRVHYSRVSGDIIYNLVPPETADVLAKMATTLSVAAALDGYNPQQPGYKALKAKLAEARASKGEAPARIAAGPVLKVGMQDPRVPLVRQRLGAEGDAAGTTFDKPLAEAVKKFQRERKLQQTGTLNGATIDAINGPRRDRDADVILANLERWRWMPRDLGRNYVMVNIPDFSLRVTSNGSLAWQTRIVVGKPGTPTPLLSETMKFITVNPTWNVPPSIIYNEYLPALKQDPDALSRIGLKVEQNRDGSVRIYQPPGERNALGRIRFNFPNKFLVYQHDTPDKNLFAHDRRAYSHGCMRVQNPDKYAEVLLGIALPKEGYTADKIRGMYGRSESQINFPTPIPVHITYQTAFVDDSGKLVIKDDIYGRDSRLLAVLKGDERRMAEIPVERREKPIRREAYRLPERDAGLSFFDRLFR